MKPRQTKKSPERNRGAPSGDCHMTLSELLTLLALGISLLMLIVTVIYDTIDIVLRLKELQTKNEQKK